MHRCVRWPCSLLNQGLGKDVITAYNAGKRVFITGHSLGGAVAMITALQFAFNHMTVHGVYTFGAPMAGKGEAYIEAYG